MARISETHRMSRAEWIKTICSNDWPDRKPKTDFEQESHGSSLVRMLSDMDYLKLYISYLISHQRQPTNRLLQDLLKLGYREVAFEIKEAVENGIKDIS